jgi:hypothetical protein
VLPYGDPATSEYRRRLAGLAREHGYQLEKTSGGHYRLLRPDKPPIVAAFSPRFPTRTLANLRALIRRHAIAERDKPP